MFWLLFSKPFLNGSKTGLQLNFFCILMASFFSNESTNELEIFFFKKVSSSWLASFASSDSPYFLPLLLLLYG